MDLHRVARVGGRVSRHRAAQRLAGLHAEPDAREGSPGRRALLYHLATHGCTLRKRSTHPADTQTVILNAY